jgi:hypothetical protein
VWPSWFETFAVDKKQLLGLKPALTLELDAALKRSSWTVLRSFGARRKSSRSAGRSN